MSNGFDIEEGDQSIEELNRLVKKYKKLNKYTKSSIFAVKTMDNNEKIISDMVEELKNKPLE